MAGRAAMPLLIVITLLALTALPAQAGGWATVTLDAPLAEARAGNPVRIGFTVKQHGVTPIHDAYGEPVALAIRAWLPKTGTEVRVTAQKDMVKVGHFTADLTFPSAGVWEWEAIPAPFAGSALPPVTVIEGPAARVGPAAEAQLGATQAQVRAGKADRSGTIVTVFGLAALVIAAGGLILMLRQRRA